MSDVTVTAANVRQLGPVHGCFGKMAQAAVSLSLGDLVYELTDGTYGKADANAGSPAQTVAGMAVESKDGDTTIASGDWFTLLEVGPVEGFSGATPGSLAYLSNTAGKVATAAPVSGFNRIVGRFQTATCLWLAPVLSDAASA